MGLFWRIELLLINVLFSVLKTRTEKEATLSLRKKRQSIALHIVLDCI